MSCTYQKITFKATIVANGQLSALVSWGGPAVDIHYIAVTRTETEPLQ